MRLVPVSPRSIDDYRPIVSDKAVNSLQRVAWQIEGSSLLNVNSTAYGGGVAELLLAQIPLLQDLGISAQWGVIDGDERFFEITKTIHNGLQGNHDLEWTQDMEQHYLACVGANLASLPTGLDVAVIHDPQPLAILSLLGPRAREVASKWVWRLHIDCADPHPGIWSFVRDLIEPYDAAVFTMREFVQEDVPAGRVVICPPSIDPLSPKNAPLAPITVTDICRQYRIDPERPIMAQISRFDRWKDPLGVIEAYRTVKRDLPEVQLILAGSLAHDDPEGLRFYDDVLHACDGDPDIFVLSNFQEVGNTAVNCFQRAAGVVLQKSIREGFGLTVAEAGWKERCVVGGRAGGITLQIDDGRTGYLVESVEECAARTAELLADPQRAAQMGRAARELIGDRFLTTREVSDWVGLAAELLRA
ncbi:MAG TPA: glycosyltransferase [Actinomycetota bacterium]|nr:glycosyltransferase [Actinomycetota bacterium]